MVSEQAALVYTMVLVSAADGRMTDMEMRTIGDMVGHLPAFRDYDTDLLPRTLEACAEILDAEDGLEQALALIKATLPEPLRETAYTLACDLVAAEGSATQETLRLLEILRHRLDLDRLIAAAIERGSRARYATL